MTYTCKDCGQGKPETEMFWTNSRTPTGQCKECRRAYRKALYHRDPEPAIRASVKWKRENRDKSLDANRKAKYGMAYGEYDRLLAEQGGGCAICADPPADRSLHVDHDHQTGVIRALLCDRCNRGLGYFRDDPELLVGAAAYLRSHKVAVA